MVQQTDTGEAGFHRLLRKDVVMKLMGWIACGLIGLILAPAAMAQDAPIRVAVCNVVKVFQDLDESKDIQTRLKSELEKIRLDSQRKDAEIKEIQKRLTQYKPGSTAWIDTNKQLTEAVVQFEVWARSTELQIMRTEKEYLKSQFEKVRDAVKEIAEEKKVDLVLTERRPDVSNIEKLKPDDLRALLLQTDVLFSNSKVDITDEVVLRMNKKYAAAGAAQPERK